jgi:serine/threonine protein kinase
MDKKSEFGRSKQKRYKKQSVIGSGAYGEVYKGIDTKTKTQIAIKKIKLDVESEGIPSTALREIALLREIEHDHVVKYSNPP